MRAERGSKIDGREKLRRTFKALPERVRKETVAAVVKSAEELADTQRRLAPSPGSGPYATGDLRDSIAVTGPGGTTPPYSQPGGSTRVEDHQAVVTVGNTDVRYGHLVEYGTAKAPAQPFFWPAYRILKKRLLARISRAGRKAIRESAK